MTNKDNRKTILLVEDDELFHSVVKACLQEKYHVSASGTGEQALEILRETATDLILLDINLPGMDGIEFLKKVKQEYPDLPIIMLSAVDYIPEVVKTVKLGAYDYLTKPVDEERLNLTIERALEALDIRRELEQHRRLQADINKGFKLLGNSPGLNKIRNEITVLANTDSILLIHGETGTGKELLAREIHANSQRATGPFVAINCGAIPKDLVESELFGHKKGAFTGAQKEPGKFRLANQGTLLLDEISELPVPAQAKLLRVLQEHEFYPVGSSELIRVDVRVIASTNKDLTEMVRKGTFREDLYYRLNVFGISIAPLRERPEDILTLAYHFIKQNNVKFDKDIRKIDPEAEKALLSHAWKGNVRELQNLLEKIALFSESPVIEEKDLDFVRQSKTVDPSRDLERTNRLPENGLDAELENLEKRLIEKALKLAKWNKTEAAKLLKLSRPALEYRLEKHQLN